jgi:hypothetical protein
MEIFDEVIVDGIDGVVRRIFEVPIAADAGSLEGILKGIHANSFEFY